MATRKSGSSHSSTKKRMSSSPGSNYRHGGKTIKAAVGDFLLDRQSQNHSPQTLRWHTIALDHFVTFLEKQHTLTYLQDLEAVHIRAWLVFLEKEVGPRGKVRAARTRRWYAQSMHAFCHWLHDENYVEEDPAARVKLPKIEKPLIRIIEFEEFEALLAACAPPRVKDFDADRNTARNQAILWLLWDTGIRLREICNLRLSDFDRRQGTIIVFGKGRKERRVALGRNALRALLYYLDRWRQDSRELEEIGNADEDSIASPKSSSVGPHSLFLSGFRKRCHEATSLPMTSGQTTPQPLSSRQKDESREASSRRVVASDLWLLDREEEELVEKAVRLRERNER